MNIEEEEEDIINDNDDDDDDIQALDAGAHTRVGVALQRRSLFK